MANYAREKSRYGGHTGSILIHSTPGLGSNNDPSAAVFKNNLPAGYLKCDGSVQNAKDYYALSRILGVGDASRFKKDNTTLKNADPLTGDLGQFQLPDLGSKVVIGGRATGTYVNDVIETEGTQTTFVNRVGPQIDVVSNAGNRISASYVGNLLVSASGTLNMLGSPKYIIDRSTTSTALDLENFQGHAHNSSQNYLNYSATHQVGGEGGKDRSSFSGNSGSGNQLDESNTGGGSSVHSHGITRPLTYSSNFTYTHGQKNISMENVSAYIDVELSNEKKLDQLVTPFVLVEYIIKF
jgi:hypothetical protein